MTVISKLLFDTKIGPEVSCRNILHPWTHNCAKANLTLLVTRCFSGVFFFYMSIYLVKLLTDRKRPNKTYLKKIAGKFLRSWCYGVSYAFLTFFGICLNYNILGKFYYHTIGFVPGLLGGLSLLFEDNEYRLLNAVLWSTLVIEALFKNLYYFKIFEYSVFRETVMFMLTSSLLMYLIKKRSLEGKKVPPTFWIYVPFGRKSVFTFTRKNYFMEIIKYFGIAYGLSSARSLISVFTSVQKLSIETLSKAIFNQKNTKFGMVLGVYAALFRGSLILLRKSNYFDETTDAALAGFIAGICYCIKPSTNFLAIGIATVLQMLLKEIIKASKSGNILITVLIYMFSNGILFQNRILTPTTCPKYFANMLKMASNRLIDEILSRLYEKYTNTNRIGLTSL